MQRMRKDGSENVDGLRHRRQGRDRSGRLHVTKRGFWKTADGRVLRIADMETEHLRASLALVDRHIGRCRLEIGSARLANGEIARVAAGEAEARAQLRKAALVAKRRELQAEIDRRG